MKSFPFILLLLFVFCNRSNAQTDSLKVVDSTSITIHDFQKKWYTSRYIRESYIPAGLALGSVAIISIPGLKESLQKPLKWNYNPTTKGIYTSLYEDQIRYVPAIAAYAIRSEERRVGKE